MIDYERLRMALDVRRGKVEQQEGLHAAVYMVLSAFLVGAMIAGALLGAAW